MHLTNKNKSIGSKSFMMFAITKAWLLVLGLCSLVLSAEAGYLKNKNAFRESELNNAVDRELEIESVEDIEMESEEEDGDGGAGIFGEENGGFGVNGGAGWGGIELCENYGGPPIRLWTLQEASISSKGQSHVLLADVSRLASVSYLHSVTLDRSTGRTK